MPGAGPSAPERRGGELVGIDRIGRARVHLVGHDPTDPVGVTDVVVAVEEGLDRRGNDRDAVLVPGDHRGVGAERPDEVRSRVGEAVEVVVGNGSVRVGILDVHVEGGDEHGDGRIERVGGPIDAEVRFEPVAPAVVSEPVDTQKQLLVDLRCHEAALDGGLEGRSEGVIDLTQRGDVVRFDGALLPVLGERPDQISRRLDGDRDPGGRRRGPPRRGRRLGRGRWRVRPGRAVRAAAGDANERADHDREEVTPIHRVRG